MRLTSHKNWMPSKGRSPTAFKPRYRVISSLDNRSQLFISRDAPFVQQTRHVCHNILSLLSLLSEPGKFISNDCSVPIWQRGADKYLEYSREADDTPYCVCEKCEKHTRDCQHQFDSWIPGDRGVTVTKLCRYKASLFQNGSTISPTRKPFCRCGLPEVLGAITNEEVTPEIY